MATVGIVAATAISLSGLERSRQTRNMGITIGPLCCGISETLKNGYLLSYSLTAVVSRVILVVALSK